MTERFVVIGGGCASLESVKAARESGFGGEIAVMSDNNLPPYNPMLITYYASGKIGYDALFPYVEDGMYDKYDVTCHDGSPVVRLDTEKSIVQNSKGVELEYTACVVASGASPAIPGAFSKIKDKVYTLRSVADAVKFKELLESDKKRAMVVGASMIGIKAVEALADAGFSVTLTDFADRIFPLASHKNCSEMIEGILREKNVNMLFGKTAEKIEEDAAGLSVFFSEEEKPTVVDHIIVCAGVRPNMSFVDPGRVKTDKGILVNEHMETSAYGVYAAGDVCQGLDISSGDMQVLGLLSDARLQGRTAGENIAGKRSRYSGSLPHNITHFFNNDFVAIGNVNDGDRAYEDACEASKRFIRLAFKDNKLTGVNLLNVPEISGILKYSLTKGITAEYALDELRNDSIAMGKLYGKFPGIENAFTERG